MPHRVRKVFHSDYKWRHHGNDPLFYGSQVFSEMVRDKKLILCTHVAGTSAAMTHHSKQISGALVPDRALVQGLLLDSGISMC